MLFLLQIGHISCHTNLSAHLTSKAQTCSGVTYEITFVEIKSSHSAGYWTDLPKVCMEERGFIIAFIQSKHLQVRCKSTASLRSSIVCYRMLTFSIVFNLGEPKLEHTLIAYNWKMNVVHYVLFLICIYIPIGCGRHKSLLHRMVTLNLVDA